MCGRGGLGTNISFRLFPLSLSRISFSARIEYTVVLPVLGVIYTVRSHFVTVPFYDDSLLRPLSSRAEHSQLVVLHCCDSSVLSLFSELLALFLCACVSSFSILVQLF